MATSRQNIFNYIIDQQSTTVDELSKVFRVTPANIRHHLSILIEQGAVKVIGSKPSVGKGRPAQIYTTRQQNDQHNLDHLADALLRALAQRTSGSNSTRQIREIANCMSSEFNTDIANPTRRLYAAIQSLNRMNYHAHWEAHIENPRIMFGHCPYRAILADHPELCELDSSLLENLLATPVLQVEKLAVNSKGLPQCMFLINRSLSSSTNLYE